MRLTKKASIAAFLLPLTMSVPLWAAEKDAAGSDATSNANEEPGKTEGADVKVEGANGETKAVKELDPGEIERAKQAEMANSPLELPNKTYYFVGMRYRGLLLPKFMMNLFGDGGTSVYSNAFGPEVTIRRNNFEYVLSAWWADYSMDPTPFKASSDQEQAWEIVTSKMNALYLTSDFNWSSQINPVFGLNLGLGAGFGFVWGDLNRVQAYRQNGSLVPCTAPGVPDGNYCGGDNNHYGNYKEPSWTGGGSKPIVFPWFALQTGLRIKPHKNFMMRVDAGWAITGPFFGVSGNYGL